MTALFVATGIAAFVGIAVRFTRTARACTRPALHR